MKMMKKYSDTLLQNKDIKWRVPKWKISEDGKVDIDIHIPLTAILRKQAYWSFNWGVAALLEFLKVNKDLPLGELTEKLNEAFTEWRKP